MADIRREREEEKESIRLNRTAGKFDRGTTN
jgi:hypothetical protein